MIDESVNLKTVELKCIIYKDNTKWFCEVLGADFKTSSKDIDEAKEVFEDSLFNYLLHNDIDGIYNDVSQNIKIRQKDILNQGCTSIIGITKINAGLTSVVLEYKILET